MATPIKLVGVLRDQEGKKLDVPVLVAPWMTSALQEHVTVQIEVPSSASAATVDAHVADDRKGLVYSHTVSKYIINPGEFLDKFGDVFGGEHAKRIALNKAASKLPRKEGTDDVVMKMHIDLPFPVNKRFFEEEFGNEIFEGKTLHLSWKVNQLVVVDHWHHHKFLVNRNWHVHVHF